MIEFWQQCLHMSDATITIRVSRDTQRRIHEIAKAQGFQVMSFGAMIYEQAVRDFDAGKLKIVTPEPTLERVTKLPKPAKKAKRRTPLDARPCKDR